VERISNTGNSASIGANLVSSSNHAQPASPLAEKGGCQSQNTKIHDSGISYSPIKNFELKEYQKDAIRVLNQGKSVIVTAPTGTGKTILAYAEMMNCLREGREYIYTAPLKSINDQKLQEFRNELRDQLLKDPELFKKATKQYPSDSAKENSNLAEKFASDNVGLLTGDRKLNPHAQFRVMTTEIYNMMSQNTEQLKANRSVVFDEMHYLDDEDRGGIWEESIIFSPAQTKILGLSATIGNADKLVTWINNKVDLQALDRATRSLGASKKIELITVPESERPVKLKHYYFNSDSSKNFKLHDLDSKEILEAKSETESSSTEDKLTEQLIGLSQILRDNDRVPAIYFIFNRELCDDIAMSLANAQLDLVTAEEREKITQRIDKALQEHPYLALEDLGPEGAGRLLLEQGIGVHHATKLPEYKELIAELFQEGLIKIVPATSTLSAGINMPAKTTVITSFEKFNGTETLPLTVSEFKQMAGRAGRSGLDTEGNVVSFIDPNKSNELRIH
jgi:superfamily II RNA helicase